MRRRSYLTSVGALAAIGTLGTASAKQAELVSAEEAGVLDGVERLYQEGKIDQAERLLESHGVRYTSSRRTESRPTTSESSGPSTEGHYSEGSSEIYMSMVEGNDADEWLATGVMTLKNRKTSLRDAAIVDDACGIVYDNSEWSSVDPSEDNVTLSCSTDANGSCSVSIDDYEPNRGVGVKVDLPYYLNGETTVNVQTYLTPVDSGNDDIPVKFEYDHIWTTFNTGQYVDISVGWGALELDLTKATVLWDDHITAAPGEYAGPE